MLSGGYFYRSQLRPDQGYRIFNTWLGDPSKLLLLEKVVDVVKRDKLLENIQSTGESMLKGLKEIQARFPNHVENARGIGTFCAIDLASADLRNELIRELHKSGVHCGGSGVRSLRVRTSLTFTKKHSDIFLDRLNYVLTKMSTS